MCDSLKEPDAETCKTCGYIFEDLASSLDSAPRLKNSWLAGTTVSDGSLQQLDSTGSPLFVSSTPMRTHMISAVTTAIVAVPVILGAGHDIYSFVLGVALPVAGGLVSFLFSAKKYEFFDNLLLMKGVVGRSSDVQYSELKIQRPWRGRWRGMVLSRTGKRRPMLIQSNPRDGMGETLTHFLEKKLYKTAHTY